MTSRRRAVISRRCLDGDTAATLRPAQLDLDPAIEPREDVVAIVRSRNGHSYEIRMTPKYPGLEHSGWQNTPVRHDDRWWIDVVDLGGTNLALIRERTVTWARANERFAELNSTLLRDGLPDKLAFHFRRRRI